MILDELEPSASALAVLKELRERNILAWVVINASSLREVYEQYRRRWCQEILALLLNDLWIFLKCRRRSDRAFTVNSLSSALGSAGYKVVHLEKMMRNCQAVAKTASVDNIRDYVRGDFVRTILTPELGQSSCSTVPGRKPVCVLYNNGWLDTTFNRVNYGAISEAVREYFNHVNIDPANCTDKVAILLGNNISSSKIVTNISLPNVKLYDAGVDMFDSSNVPHYYDLPCAELERQKSDLQAWLDHGGILLSHAQQFKGCEATNVVTIAGFINNHSPLIKLSIFFAVGLVYLVGAFLVCFYWGLYPGSVFILVGFIILMTSFLLTRHAKVGSMNYRSDLTRAVAGLGLVVDRNKVKRQEIRKHFEIIELTKMKLLAHISTSQDILSVT